MHEYRTDGTGSAATVRNFRIASCNDLRSVQETLH